MTSFNSYPIFTEQLKRAKMEIEFNQLEPGVKYNLIDTKWGCQNTARLICFDYTGLKRDICYFQKKGFPMTEQQVKEMFQADIVNPNIFCMWAWEMKYIKITRIN